MATMLRQSTAVTIAIGPFLDETSGKDVEGALTLTQPDIRLSKNGGAFAQKSAAQTLSHMENGYYSLSLSTTDTNTVGHLVVHVHETGALPVWKEFQVLEEAVYDAFFASGATAQTGLSAAQVNAEVDQALADYDGPTHAETLAAADAVNVKKINDVTLTGDGSSTPWGPA